MVCRITTSMQSTRRRGGLGSALLALTLVCCCAGRAHAGSTVVGQLFPPPNSQMSSTV
ncbi:MAG: hypothetical protein QOE14_3077, partial [Humisphaera sp.]|nr:hypothetical protein [Humisphaera sp.]